MQSKEVDCVIVTYNRVSLLKECLEAVLNQSYPIKNIFVIDNHSTDDTPLFLEEAMKKYKKIKSFRLKENVGGAGGFNVGMKAFITKSKAEYVWIMDDDTVPTQAALSTLMKAALNVKGFGFLASNVRWINGEAAVMNVPGTIGDWNAYASKGLVRVKYASFVSLLFPRNVVKKVGFPIKEFFIWGDDYEYTTRITRAGYKNYFVSDSTVEHKIKKNIGANIFLENNRSRIDRYFYDMRNRVFTVRKMEGKKQVVKLLFRQGIMQPVKLLISSSPYKKHKAWIAVKGTFKGLFFNPKIERIDKN